MTAWTWEVSIWVGFRLWGLKDIQIEMQMMKWHEKVQPDSSLCLCRFLCFVSFQILMPTTFSRHSLEVQGVLVSKVTYVLFESKNLSLCQPFGRSPTIWEYPKCANGFVFIIFSIWTWKFLLPVWLIGRVDYLNSYYIRTFQQCQPHNPSSVFNNWLICKSVSCLCHWLNECNPMQQMPV